MKTIYLCCLLALVSLSAVAQELQKDFINYKGLATNADGTAIANTTVNLQIALRFGDANATASYIESHAVLTDDNGIFSIQIGNGTLVAGAYQPELWGTEASYISTAINGVDTGTVELMAVPYAISAGNALNTVWEKNENDDITNTNEGNVLMNADLNISGTLAVNADNQINPFTDFTLTSQTNQDFGGMYINSPDPISGKPFYGYAVDGVESAFHYYDAVDSSWKLFVGANSFGEAIQITDAGDVFVNGRVAFNDNSQINQFTDFTLTSLNTSGFGGMYINSPDLNSGKPFYGYAVDGVESAFHYYDAEDGSWKLFVGATSFEEAIKITDNADIDFKGRTTTTSYDNTGPDLILGGNSNTTSGDDGIISSDPNYAGSDIFLRSNDAVVIRLDVDNNEIGEFEIKAGNGTEVFEVNESGQVRANGTLVHSSDRRLKENIEDLNYGLAEILQLEPKAYHWKNKEQDYKSIGLIAQDVMPIIDEIVVSQDNEEKTLGISYTELIPVLINAIKEQQFQIESLKNTIQNKDTAQAEVLKRLNKLEKLMFDTQQQVEVITESKK